MNSVWRGWPPPGQIAGSVVTLGVFDGFHRGHQELVDQSTTYGALLDLPVVLVTFDPHPLTILAPDRAPRRLLPLTDRIARAFAQGVDHVVILPFTKDLARLSASEFVEQGLVQHLTPRVVLVGENFRCGHGGEGDIAFLTAAGSRLGFGVTPVDLVHQDGIPCSSTEVRRRLAHGDKDGAAEMLGAGVRRR